jgi:hypothetical protein
VRMPDGLPRALRTDHGQPFPCDFQGRVSRPSGQNDLHGCYSLTFAETTSRRTLTVSHRRLTEEALVAARERMLVKGLDVAGCCPSAL